jgi:hypothetical protein
MSRDHRSVWQRGARLWAVAPLLAALLLTLASVAVAADGELPSGHVTPAFGPAAGGTAVAISGSGFTGAMDVTFGGGAATNVAVNGDGTAITATTPAHDVGAVPVVVTGADGTLVTVGGFFFIPATTATAVTVTGVNPLMGSTAGHTPVVITGSGFRDGAQVAFGGAAATGVRVLADAIIIAVTPAHDAGAVAVTVTNRSGQSGSLDSAFMYVTPSPAPAPTITRIEPAMATASGLSPTSTALDDHHGQSVAIIGTDFQPDASVTFGGTPVDHTTTLSSTVILTTAPDHAAGKVDVVVTNPDNGSATLTQGFEYVAPTPGAPPTIAGIDPTSGPTGDHTRTLVTITGTGFPHDAAVTFGGVAAHDALVIADGTILALAPSHVAGAVDVIVTNPDGQSAISPQQFTYAAPTPGAPPKIATVVSSPGSADDHGSPLVTITGTGFVRGATVMFGDTVADHAEVIGSTVILATAPHHAPGTVGVTVTNPDGQSDTLANAYTFVAPTTAALSISAVEPEVGLAAGGMRVRVRGTGFAAGVTVTFDTTPGTNIEIIDSTLLVVTTPAHAVGTVNVTVTNAAGDVNTLSNGYGYIATAPNHRSPGTTSPTGGQPPAPLPTGGRKDPGIPNTPGTAGIAGGGATPADPSPAHR